MHKPIWEMTAEERAQRAIAISWALEMNEKWARDQRLFEERMRTNPTPGYLMYQETCKAFYEATEPLAVESKEKK